jgi:hypothetical protein
MVGPQNMENQNIVKIVRAEKTKTLFHEIEPNPYNDRAMHYGDNSFF